MYLHRISILNYKNIKEADLSLSPKINCFIGNNGVGKTNLLDAVYYLSFCKSHSGTMDAQNVRHDADFFVLHGFYKDDEGAETDVYCGFKRRQKKQFRKNKKNYERISEHIGVIPLVIISPSDSKLIQEGSEERRKFIDGVISQYDKRYLNALLAYNRALQQRNVLLKTEGSDPLLFDIWEEQMAENGSYIYMKRVEFIDRFSPLFQYFYSFISLERESVGFAYSSHLHDGADLRELLHGSRGRDALVGYTTKGIHRDDLEMLLHGHPIKRVGSQGQNKTFLIALKLAQFDFLRNINLKMPLLLFDDIFDKLDALRVQQIVKLVKEDNRFGQIFISDTNREHTAAILKDCGGDFVIYAVDGGEFSCIEKGGSDEAQ